MLRPHIELNLYKTMVRPHIEHANQVWHPRRLQDVDKLEGVQKKATKIINHKREEINI